MKSSTVCDQIIIFDTTLRDGEQAPGCSMSNHEKIELSQSLEELGVDVIEAGTPMSSPGEFKAVTEISKLIANSAVAVATKSREEDIRHAWNAVKFAKHPRIHTYISTSQTHMKSKIRMCEDEVLNNITKSVSFARSLCPDIEWSAEDATRTEFDFLCRCIETAINAGANTVNIPDSVGCTEPDKFRNLINSICEHVSNIDKAVLSVHCHDDLGLATANSLAAIKGGARQIECCINGVGERAGNAALEEIVMALDVHKNTYQYKTNIVTNKISNISQLVSNIFGIRVPPNKAITGENAFSHKSDHHSDVTIDQETYQIITPKSVGCVRSPHRLDKHADLCSLKLKIMELDYDLTEDQYRDAFNSFIKIADVKKNIEDDDIHALVNESVLCTKNTISFVSLSVQYSSDDLVKVEIAIERDGIVKNMSEYSSSPINAIFTAIDSIFHQQVQMRNYQVKNVAAGLNTQTEVSIVVTRNGHSAKGICLSHDVLSATARSYISALNKLEIKEKNSSSSEFNNVLEALSGVSDDLELDDTTSFRMGDMSIDETSMTGIRDSLKIDLTDRDLRILRHLVNHCGEVVSKERLYNAGWLREFVAESRALEQHIMILRRKIDPDKKRMKLIDTIHGAGYRYTTVTTSG